MEKVKQLWTLAKANPKISVADCGSNCCHLFFSNVGVLC